MRPLLAQPLHRRSRADGVGQYRLDPGVGRSVISSVRANLPAGPALPELARAPARAARSWSPHRPRRFRPASPTWLMTLGERERQRGSAVPGRSQCRSARPDVLLAMQMAERDVVQASEHRRRESATPPTLRSLSESQVIALVTRRMRCDHDRPIPRPAASARISAVGGGQHRSVRALRAQLGHRPRRAADTGCRRWLPHRARRRSPPAGRCRRRSVRKCTPASSLSLEPNPSLTAESWLPLVSSTGMPAAAKPRSAWSSTATASTGGTARS